MRTIFITASVLFLTGCTEPQLYSANFIFPQNKQTVVACGKDNKSVCIKDVKDSAPKANVKAVVDERGHIYKSSIDPETNEPKLDRVSDYKVKYTRVISDSSIKK